MGVLVLFANKVLFYILLMLFFLSFNEGVSPTSITKYADEVFLLVSLIIILAASIKDVMSLRIGKIQLVLIFYLIYQYINYLFSQFQLDLLLVLAQSLINLKVFLVAIASVLVMKSSKSSKAVIVWVFYLFLGLFLIGMIMQFIFMESWNSFFGYRIDEYRYGVLRPAGWFVSTEHLSYYFCLTFFTLYTLNSKKSVSEIAWGGRVFLVVTIFSFLSSLLLTVRKGMYIIIPLGLSFFIKQNTGNKILVACLVIFLIPVGYFLVADTSFIQDTVRDLRNLTHGDGFYIRGLMVFHGSKLFLEFFPFGTGAGTFGTVLSQYNTLDVYQYVSLPEHFYVNELRGVYDTGLFSMLAENGFIGMLLISMFIFYYFRFNKMRLDPYNYSVFKTLTWFTIILSLTEPVWQNGMFTVFYVINLLLIYTKNGFFIYRGKWVGCIRDNIVRPLHER